MWLLLACSGGDVDPAKDGHSDPDTDGADTDSVAEPDAETLLRDAARERQLRPWRPLAIEHPKMHALGAKLFAEPLMVGGYQSGELQSCAACHAAIGPEGREYALKDVAVTGARYGRTMPTFTDIGRPEVTSWFWDGAVRVEDGVLITPMGDAVPEGTDPLVAAIMWGGGHLGTAFRTNKPLYPPPAPPEVPKELEIRWAFALDRVLGEDAYVRALRDLFPEVEDDAFTYLHLATALADYIRPSFATDHTPWDLWLAGDADAISPSAKRGGVAFFELGCDTCHSGTAFSDQQAHALAVPQFGPGIGEDAPLDRGHALQTGDEADNYAFVTPRLRNLRHTRPYMHNGAYATLKEAIQHHLDPVGMLGAYTQEKVPPCSRFFPDERFHLPIKPPLAYDSPQAAVEAMGPYIDEALPVGVSVDDETIQELVDFLETLNEPSHFVRIEQVREQGESGLWAWFF